MLKSIFLIFTISFLGFSNLYASSDKYQKAKDEYCKADTKLNKVVIFKEAYQDALAIKTEFCKEEDKDFRDIFDSTLELVKHLEKIGIPSYKYQRFIDAQKKRISSSKLKLGKFDETYNGSSKEIIVQIQGTDLGKFTLNKHEINTCNEKVKNIADNQICRSAFSEFKKIFDLAQGVLAKLDVYIMYDYLNEIDKNWLNYLENSKAQTPWEMTVNKLLYRNEKNGPIFRAPPEWQLILFHPGIMMEYVNDAEDGSQLDEALMIEALGVDWWKQDNKWLPTGASLIAHYSDRKNFDDWRYGLLVHYDHKYSIGVTKELNGNSTAIIFSLDVLKFLQNNEKEIELFEKFTGRDYSNLRGLKF